jgi:hypothetical protein
VEGGGRRRRWPPRRCARSPEGERAAVERLSDSARGPVPHCRGPASVCLLCHSARCRQDDTGGGSNDGEVGPTGRSSLPFALSLSDLGLELGDKR